MSAFPTTRWATISEAVDPDSPGFQPALSDLCETYWYPVYTLVRSEGYTPEESADLTQEYFARLISRKLLAVADQSKGRFRDLLWRDCTFFLANQRDRASARKRGPKSTIVSLEVPSAERRYGLEPSGEFDPKRRFDRAWALGIIEQGLKRLQTQEERAGRGQGFRELAPLLTEDSQATSAGVIAERLGVTEQSVRAALHRLRVRFRESLRHEVALTLGSPTVSNIDEEIQYLFEALRR
ncbi:MAG: hypothetical protein U0835_21720 [Isosphaeraceae bacterium]